MQIIFVSTLFFVCFIEFIGMTLCKYFVFIYWGLNVFIGFYCILSKKNHIFSPSFLFSIKFLYVCKGAFMALCESL